MRYRFQKAQRLHKPGEIRELFTVGQFIHGELFHLLYRPAEELRVLFTTSKQVRRKPDRNRIKRRLREVYRLEQHKLDLPRIHLGIIGTEHVQWATHRELIDAFYFMAKQIAAE